MILKGLHIISAYVLVRGFDSSRVWHGYTMGKDFPHHTCTAVPMVGMGAY